MDVKLPSRMNGVLRIGRWLRVGNRLVDEWKGLLLLWIELLRVVLNGTRLRGIRHGELVWVWNGYRGRGLVGWDTLSIR